MNERSNYRVPIHFAGISGIPFKAKIRLIDVHIKLPTMKILVCNAFVIKH